MLAYQARPPDPALREDWRERWVERLDAMPFWPALWMRRQRRDAYWRHGSVCEDFSAIQCPVFALGGWADAYTNAVPRLLVGLKAPRLGLIGPWAHLYPHDGKPGPAIGFLQEATRWWDHWLKGVDRGIMREPALRAFIEDGAEPENRDRALGRFVAEPVWPSPGIEPLVWEVNSSGLNRPGGAGVTAIRSPGFTGAAAGEWMGTGAPHEAPADQRRDDAYSLCFDSAPLAERLELLGSPEIEFEIASDKPVAQICARLCDVSPEGASRRVSYGVLNLTHRDSHAEPTPLTPGVFHRVALKLNACGYTFAAGARVRLAISTAYWPLIWPAPEAATLTFKLPGTLTLPARNAGEASQPTFPRRETAANAPQRRVADGRVERRTSFDFATGVSTYETVAKGGLFGEGAHLFEDIDTQVSHDLKRRLTIKADDPASAVYELDQNYEMGREGWRIRIATAVSMRATPSHFMIDARLDAYENGQLVRSRTFAETIARDLV